MVTRPIVSPPVQHIRGKIWCAQFSLIRCSLLKHNKYKAFLKPWNVVIKETNTSFLYWLSSLFLSLKTLIFSRKNFPPPEPTKSHIPKIPLKHSLSQNCWDTFCVSLSPLCWCTRLGIQIYKKFLKNFTSTHYVNTNKCIFSLKSHFFSAHFSFY